MREIVCLIRTGLIGRAGLSLLALGLAPLASPLAAQDGSTKGAPTSAAGQPSDSATADIVVRGLRLREDEELPVELRSPPVLGRVSRGLVADSAMFVRCAGLPRPSLLHRIVDGRPGTGETQKALHQHVLRNRGCYQGLPTVPPLPASPYYGACNPIVFEASLATCRVTYDRGAIYEQVLHDYAPDLRLSRSNTFDHATRARFRTREDLRNGAREPGARDYFFAAACMVQLRPEYALALLREAPGSDREERLRALMISDGAPCIGGIRIETVAVDPGQFRAFVAEAVYSWAVAVRRSDSLLPPAQS